MTKTYEATLDRGCFPGMVIVTEDREDGVRWRKPLRLRLDLSNHSPDGLAWGFGGSGAAQTAVALLADALGDDAAAVKLHLKFKSDQIAVLDRNAGWTMTDAEIKAWVEEETKDRRP